MRKTNLWLAACIVPLTFMACQGNEAIPGNEPIDPPAATTYTLRASIEQQTKADELDEAHTRAQVKYGNQKAGEYFMWNEGDAFRLYNLSRDGRYDFLIDSDYRESSPQSSADFTTTSDLSTVRKGDILIAFSPNLANGNVSSGLFSITSLITGFVQTKTDSPGNADLKHLRESMCMYATTTATADGKISELSFKHLTALFRYTLVNNSDAAIEIDFINTSYSVGDNIFRYSTEFEWSSTNGGVVRPVFVGNFLQLEFKEGAAYATLAAGSTYDAFVAFFPVEDVPFAENSTLTISVGAAVGGVYRTLKRTIDTSLITEANGGVDHFEAGKRYWFDFVVSPVGEVTGTINGWSTGLTGGPGEAN